VSVSPKLSPAPTFEQEGNKVAWTDINLGAKKTTTFRVKLAFDKCAGEDEVLSKIGQAMSNLYSTSIGVETFTGTVISPSCSNTKTLTVRGSRGDGGGSRCGGHFWMARVPRYGQGRTRGVRWRTPQRSHCASRVPHLHVSTYTHSRYPQVNVRRPKTATDCPPPFPPMECDALIEETANGQPVYACKSNPGYFCGGDFKGTGKSLQQCLDACQADPTFNAATSFSPDDGYCECFGVAATTELATDSDTYDSYAIGTPLDPTVQATSCYGR